MSGGRRTGTGDLAVEGRSREVAEVVELCRCEREHRSVLYHATQGRGTGRLTRELLGEGGRARERADGRVAVQAEGEADADLLAVIVPGVGLSGSGDSDAGEGEGSSDVLEELHIGEVGWGEWGRYGSWCVCLYEWEE